MNINADILLRNILLRSTSTFNILVDNVHFVLVGIYVSYFWIIKYICGRFLILDINTNIICEYIKPTCAKFKYIS